MFRIAVLRVALASMSVGTVLLNAQAPSAPAPAYDVDYIGPPLADPVMQHAKETYVLFGCAYCHGVTLTPRGEAADLMHSARVGADVDANVIGPLLRAGIPQTAKLSPMPQFSDLSDRQIADLARYIHYARQQGRYRELTTSPVVRGDAAAGRTFFEGNCASCHATDLTGIGRKYAPDALREAMLAPRSVEGTESFEVARLRDVRRASAQQRHHMLLENYTPTQVADLLTYLQTR
jgi:mono/diheme cytochrome c family protein